MAAELVRRPAAAWRDLAARVLVAAGASAENAAPVAQALVAAERDGHASHGLSRLPFYADELAAGRVDGRAQPDVRQTADAALQVDARDGFAYPALEAALSAAAPLARAHGVAVAAIGRSHHCGSLGYWVERIAEAGLVGLLTSNSPAAIAPWGGKTAVLGTNPLAFALPRAERPPLVIDLSLSVAARGRIMMAAQAGEPIPEGWALDAEGHPTTDAKAALAGTMAALGGAKGTALALMVELLSAGLTQSNFGHQASSFFAAEGPPPRIGQLALLLDPSAFGGAAMLAHCETLLARILAEPGARLPGERRLSARAEAERRGIGVPRPLVDALEARAPDAQG